MAVHIGDRAEQKVDMAAEEIAQGRDRAAIGHVRHLELCGVREQLARQMIDGADARRAVLDRLALRLGLFDQVGNRADRRFRIDHDDIRHRADEPDRCEVLAFIAGVLGEAERDGQRRIGAEQDRVAVRRALRDRAGADRAAGAAAVVDHDRLLERVAQLVGDGAGDDAGAAARRERNDQRDRLCRIILRAARFRERRGRQRAP